MYAASDSLGATDQRSASGEEESDTAIGGGAGAVTAWDRPDLAVAAPGGIGAFTPASVIVSAGNSATLVAGQDIQLLAQGNLAASIKGGLVLYTYGEASDTKKPNQETGIKLHAASGSVSSQSLSGTTKLTADKAVSVASTGGMVRITAPNSILLTAAGAAIDMQAGSITLKAPGAIAFKASSKVWTGPGSASQSLDLKSADLKDCRWLKQ
jgi:type VI secretion system secreted protein VgrG